MLLFLDWNDQNNGLYLSEPKIYTTISTINLHELPDLAALSWIFIRHHILGGTENYLEWKHLFSFALSRNTFSKIGKPLMDNNVISNYIIWIWKIIINLSHSKNFFKAGTLRIATTQAVLWLTEPVGAPHPFQIILMTSAEVQFNLFHFHWNRTGAFRKWITSNHQPICTHFSTSLHRNVSLSCFKSILMVTHMNTLLEFEVILTNWRIGKKKP